MNFSSQKKRIIIALAVIAFLLLPVTILLINRQQTVTTLASSGTTLTFEPSSNEGQPIKVATEQEATLDLMVEPGEGNLISFVKFVVEYDPDVLELEEGSFAPNTESFPEQLEEITIEDGTLTGSVSVGSDPSKAVSKPTKIGTLHFTPKKETSEPTVVTYTADSQVLSVGEEDDPDTSVLSNTGAAFLVIAKGEAPAEEEEEVTEDPENENTEDTAVRERFPTDITDPDPQDGETILSINAILHGIGVGGDSVNPKNSSQSNKDPKMTSRVVAFSIWDSEDLLVADGFTKLTYDKPSGMYKGSFVTDKPFPDDTYAITITAEGYLTSVIEEVEIAEGEENDLGDIAFVAGDIYPDEKLDISDYNILVDCGYGATAQLPMDDPKSPYQSEACKKHTSRSDADLDSNGVIDAKDFNLFLREFAAQKKLEATEEEPAEATPTPTETEEE